MTCFSRSSAQMYIYEIRKRGLDGCNWTARNDSFPDSKFQLSTTSSPVISATVVVSLPNPPIPALLSTPNPEIMPTSTTAPDVTKHENPEAWYGVPRIQVRVMSCLIPATISLNFASHCGTRSDQRPKRRTLPSLSACSANFTEQLTEASRALGFGRHHF